MHVNKNLKTCQNGVKMECLKTLKNILVQTKLIDQLLNHFRED